MDIKSLLEVKQIYPWLYSIKDSADASLDVYCYLILGNNKALLYDNGYGVANLKDAINSVTSNPIIAVLGHGHIDHANGSYQFDEVYLHEDDFELCLQHTSPRYRKSIIKNCKEIPEDYDKEAFYSAGAGNLVKLDIGKIFDLGDLSVEVIEMAGHTKGSVGLLIKEKKVLLDSDAASGHVWVFLEESTSIDQYVKMLERVVKLDFDTFFTGHSTEPQPKSEFYKYIKVAKDILINKFDGAVPFGMFDHLNPYIYKDDGVEIVFNSTTLGNNNH